MTDGFSVSFAKIQKKVNGIDFEYIFEEVRIGNIVNKPLVIIPLSESFFTFAKTTLFIRR